MLCVSIIVNKIFKGAFFLFHMKTNILLDTNFIIACVNQKIDFLEGIKRLFYLYDIIIPKQVMSELRKISDDDSAKREDREGAMVALEILKSKRINGIKFPDLKEENTDKAIIDFAEANKNSVIATLDKELKESLKDKARILIIRDKKKIEVL